MNNNPEANPDSKPKSSGEELFSPLLSILFLAIPVGVVCYLFFPTHWYAFMNATDTNRVHIEAEPSDCDFLKAPIGTKSCHFEKRVTTETDSTTGKVSVYVFWEKIEDK